VGVVPLSFCKRPYTTGVVVSDPRRSEPHPTLSRDCFRLFSDCDRETSGSSFLPPLAERMIPADETAPVGP